MYWKHVKQLIIFNFIKINNKTEYITHYNLTDIRNENITNTEKWDYNANCYLYYIANQEYISGCLTSLNYVTQVYITIFLFKF